MIDARYHLKVELGRGRWPIQEISTPGFGQMWVAYVDYLRQ